ncbi:alpha/beta hydrolase [Tsuneonella sp. CC-YZS046]|uniref:alpha/beta hydrolase n=1 Tax=Tsuneonella sp. CC-YZS046 TaxID=3042152 RepID=UPI002D790B41|nr:alpha/beta hydrolase [Tsuneonella sp. CC-YZS046]WRO67058.1 alpha/beta hydrolase [Tsuneonella sp. CC-YZS046]
MSEAENVLRMNSDLRDAWLENPDYTYDDIRRIFEDWLDQFEIPEGSIFEEADLGGVPCLWAKAPGSSADRVIIHYHSGGYLIGSARGYRSFGGFLSAATGCRVLLPDYRLAPDHPFPAGVDDALSVYRGLLEAGAAPSKIVLCGDSAGGGLCLVTLLRIRDAGLPPPAGGIAISPLADFTHSGASRQSNEGVDPLVTMKQLLAMGDTYCGDRSRSDPLLSPVFADWRGASPLLLMAGEIEMLRDDARLCAQAAISAGVEVTYLEGKEMAHIWPLYADRLSQARDSLSDIDWFVRRWMG